MDQQLPGTRRFLPPEEEVSPRSPDENFELDPSNEPPDPDAEDEITLYTGIAPPGWQMKKLKPIHKNVASLLAQGAKNIVISKMLDITPEYVSMLSRQPLMQDYIRQMCAHTGLRLEALFEKSVDVIAETLRDGSESGRLKAARLQLEATKRIGRGDGPPPSGAGSEERLLKLAERLIFLQSGQRPPGLYDAEGNLVGVVKEIPYESVSETTEAEFSEPGRIGYSERT